ncbi:hypothetical protein VCUG_01009 [Vavraia culicis subsp. floridensis]|uniref:Sm domain-containing protein n=1 Tax=Vavraia culicis (isolate floridensis) TaxID=948595 RepID=L2GVV3_VAVCU|nr:uncharacterized protein VCUG_01009 [Vavraia culicis subsp. floridensis]ELA47477.1 hypothetical protein VCUG_01009 [Vavraia culicis subsp. floridensis]
MRDPLQLVKSYLEEKVCIYLRDRSRLEGVLCGFDEHMNVGLLIGGEFMTVRGESIVMIGQE